MATVSPMTPPLRIFIGYDGREDDAYRVCHQSLLDHSSAPLLIEKLDMRRLRHAGMFNRSWYHTEGQFIDDRDHRPYSTEFAFTRFLVAPLCQWNGVALFCDCDFLWRADVAKLFALYDERFALQCVQHTHEPEPGVKMDGQNQGRYHRKNWSSLVLWNCGHPANLLLTPHRVNRERGQWLHAFDWLHRDQIGSLPSHWNWLEGESAVSPDIKAVHFTRGGPWHKGYEDVTFADEWRAVLERCK